MEFGDVLGPSSGFILIMLAIADGLVIDFLISLQQSRVDEFKVAPASRRPAYLCFRLSILFNVVSFGFILGKSDGLIN